MVEDLGDGLLRVSATVSNTGFLPTSLTDRGAVGRERPDGVVDRQVVRSPAVTLMHKGVTIVEGPARTVIPHLAGSNPFLQAATERSRSVTWVVRLDGGDGGDGEKGGDGGGGGDGTGKGAVQVVARSDKAGVAKSAWVTVP